METTTTEKTRTCKECGKTMPEENFMKNPFGYYDLCKECWHRKAQAGKKKNKTDPMKMRLKDFTPRQLMEELRFRGYTGKLYFTETHTIDLEKM